MPRLILDEMCRWYGKFASDLRRVLCKTRLIFPRINGPNVLRTLFPFFRFSTFLLFFLHHHISIVLLHDYQHIERLHLWKAERPNQSKTTPNQAKIANDIRVIFCWKSNITYLRDEVIWSMGPCDNLNKQWTVSKFLLNQSENETFIYLEIARKPVQWVNTTLLYRDFTAIYF